jgi:hypothetical protein
MVSPPVRGWASLLFEHNFWAPRQFKFSNDQIENATRCVQAAAQRTGYRTSGYCGCGFAVCELYYICRSFFLPVCRLLALSFLLIRTSHEMLLRG